MFVKVTESITKDINQHKTRLLGLKLEIGVSSEHLRRLKKACVNMASSMQMNCRVNTCGEWPQGGWFPEVCAGLFQCLRVSMSLS